MRRHKHPSHRRRGGLPAGILHAFRERQIYLRAEGEVQFITLKPWVQVGGLSIVLAALFWLAFSSINVAFKDQLLALRERGMYDARLEYEDRIAAMRNEVDRLNDRLLINQNEYLGRVDEVKAEFDWLTERHRRLVDFFRQAVSKKTAGGGAPFAVEAPPKLRPTEEIPADSHGNEPGLGSDPAKESLNDIDFGERYAQQAFRNAAEAGQPIAELKAMFAQHQRMEIALLDEALNHATTRAERARAIYRELGIDDRSVVAASDYALAAGGPLISVSYGSKDEISERMEKMLDAQEAYDKMKYEAQELPLQMPMKTIKRMTSGYGVRRDPFRRTIAMHAGVDFRSDMNSPVYATADGKVNVAGWEGAYGRMVEIIHDNGVSTRYAHLSSITVAAGDRVKRGDMVGRLGNTGRSTGPHLHYETRVKGRAIDPAKFWQVSNAVQRLSKEE